MRRLAALLLMLPTLATAGTCAVIGDSIALGVAAQMPHCWRDARIGQSSYGWDDKRLPAADTTVISLGSNDGDNPIARLSALRARLHGEVIWILPARWVGSVQDIARAWKDRIINRADARGVHPSAAGYRRMAQEIGL